MKKLSEKFITIFQPLLENSRFFRNARFGTKAEELRVCCSLFCVFPFPVPEDEAVSFEYLVQRQCWSRWVLCAIQHLICTKMKFYEITLLMFCVLEPQIPSGRGCKDEWIFRFLRHIGGKIVTSSHLERKDFKEPAESSSWGGFVWITMQPRVLLIYFFFSDDLLWGGEKRV